MKLSHDSQFVDPNFSTYAETMAEHIRKTMVKKPPTTTQAASTQATLDRNPLDDLKHQARPLPQNWKAKPHAKSIQEAVGERTLRVDEINLVESTRRRPKNSTGESNRSGTTKEGRERGIQAIIYSPPANVSKKEVQEKAVNLVEYVTHPIREEWVELEWYQALWHWIRGNSIKSETKLK